MAQANEKTLILFKPDAVARRLCGRILQRFEDKGLKLIGMKLMLISRSLAEQHYAPHKGKGFYDGLLKFMTSSPVVALALEGPYAIDVARKLMGATFGFKAEPGTIRGDFALEVGQNLIHASDGPETAATELALWFPEGIATYGREVDRWVLGPQA